MLILSNGDIGKLVNYFLEILCKVYVFLNKLFVVFYMCNINIFNNVF